MVNTTLPPGRILNKIVSVCLRQEDYDTLVAIADKNGIKMSVYLRSIIVDAIAEDGEG